MHRDQNCGGEAKRGGSIPAPPKTERAEVTKGRHPSPCGLAVAPSLTPFCWRRVKVFLEGGVVGWWGGVLGCVCVCGVRVCGPLLSNECV